MDRKTYTIIKQIKRNSDDLKEFKSTQFSGSDSVFLRLLSTTNVTDKTQVMAANERWTFYFQMFNTLALGPDDASYDSGVINLYVDTPPPAGNSYQGNVSGGLTVGSSPLLLIGTNSIEFENGIFWSITVRNIDSISHTVYSKGFCCSTMDPTNVIIGWDAVLT